MQTRQDFRFLILLAILFLTHPCAGQEAPQTDDKTASTEVSDFIRFTETEDKGKLETSIVTYEHPDGQRVDLIGVLHIADTAYYEGLNKRFEQYDALLYEMVGDPEDLNDKEALASNQNPLRALQRMIKSMLKLDYQLDAIDYQKDNFVHADLSLEQFQQLNVERGESIFTLVQNAMRKSSEDSPEGANVASQLQMDIAPILRALASPDSASALKMILAQQFDKAEQLVDSIETGDGTVILTERNKHVIKVLEEQLSKKKKKLGIFYGAAHLTDLERRLRKAGYTKKGNEWLLAWDIPKPKLPASQEAASGSEESPQSESDQ